ncbi:MAG TPA: 2-dehydropantoate 2-reductase [Pyrinomonadaceae bacterium]|nr:2-dehydropantoate 2-reductase [Pyrinomonadaceae bacterium]
MRIAVVGAGAIGGFIGAMLSKAGEDVTLVARGAHLRAMSEHGIRIKGSLGEFVTHPKVTDDPTTLRGVDLVILTLKAHSLIGIAPTLASMIGPSTSIISAQNGIPWWYFCRHGGEFDGLHLEALDPGRTLSRSFPPERTIGCVIYCSTIVSEPGVIQHLEGTRFAIGEPDGSRSERCHDIAQTFIRAGLRCPIRSNIRHDIWVKLLGSVAFNPISALSRATLLELVRCPETRDLSVQIMTEAETIAKRLGIDVAITKEQRLAGAEQVGNHKTSMLQDIEAGRPLEWESIIGVLVELANKLNLSVPHIRAVAACTKLLSQSLTRAA